jgi:hypothetical protein
VRLRVENDQTTLKLTANLRSCRRLHLYIDLLNISIDDFSIIRLASYLQEMTAGELKKVLLAVDGWSE